MEDESGYSADATVQGGGNVRSPARKNINGTWNVAPGVAAPIAPEPEPVEAAPERAISTPPDRGPSADGPDFSGLNGPTPNAPTGPDFSGLQGPSRLEGVHDVVQQADPDHTGKVLGAAKALGLDPAQVENNLPEAQKAVKAPSGELLRTIEESYPGSTNWLKDPLNMAVAKDDLHNVKRHEDLVNRVRIAHGIVDHALMGFQGGDIGLFVRNQLPDIEADPNASAVEKAVEMAAGFASDLPGYALGGAVGSVAGPVGTMAGAFGYNAALKSALTEGIKGTDFFPKLYKTAKAATEASIVGAGAGVAGLGTRLVGQTLLAGANLTGLSALAARAGITYGAIGAEALTATGLQVGIAEGRMATLQEQVTGLAQMFLLHEVMQAGKFFKGKPALEGEIQEPSKQLSAPEVAPIEGEFKVEPQAPAPETPAEPKAPTAEEIKTAAETFRTQESSVFYDKLGEAVAESKTRERLKTAHSSLMDSITKGTGLTDVIIPREDFDNYMTSQGIDPEVAATELGAKETYNQSSGNVYVPISKYTEIIGGSPHWKGLAPDIKFNADHNTQRQEETVQAGIKAEMKALEEKRQAVAEGKEPPADSVARIATEIGKSLEGAGRSKGEARAIGTALSEAFKTRGAQMGVDPYELFKRYPISAKKADGDISQAPSDTTLHQDSIKHAEILNNVINAAEHFKKPETEPTEPTAKPKKPTKKNRTALEEELKGLTEQGQDLFQSGGTEEPGARATRIARTEELKRVLEVPLADRYAARFAGEKEPAKAIKEAQDPKLGPYISDERIPGIGWTPNYAAEPTGVIGPARISQPNEVKAWEPGKGMLDAKASFTNKETDPLKWADTKWQATKHLIEKHKEAGIPLTINTSSDLVARVDYIEAMDPANTTVNMYMLTGDAGRDRILFPGNASRKRQEEAVQHLREAGVTVNEIEPTVESILKGAGGKKALAKQLGLKSTEVEADVQRALGQHLRLVSNDTLFQGAFMLPDLNVSDDYFKNPEGQGDKTLPGLSAEVLGLIGGEANKPIVLKESVAKKNLRHKKELKGRDVQVLTNALYAPTHILQAQATDHPENWNFISKVPGTSSHVLLEVSDKKSQYEIINWHPLSEEDFEKMKKRAGREGGRVLITERGKASQGAAALSALPPGSENTTPDDTGGQGTQFQGPDNPQGKIDILAPENAEQALRAAVTFFATANKSTALHELVGHYLYLVNEHLANDPLAADQMKADHEALRAWVGAKPGEPLTREQHEQVARGLEVYFREGKAPSSALRRVFERFMSWLTQIYKNADQLGVKLTDEMRDIYSRWFASQEEIDRARNDVGYTGEVPEGTPPEVQARLEDLQSEARSQAQHALMKSQMEEISSANREFLAKEKVRFTKDAKEQVRELPLYKAQAELGNKEMGAKANAFLEERVTDKEAAKWETVAIKNGFESGYELAKAVAESDAQDGFNQEVRSRVDASMEKYAPLKDTDAIRLQALEAIHDEKMTELLALEHQILEGLVNKASIKQEISNRQKVVAKSEAEAIGREARATLNSKPIKDASNVRVYITEERQAAVRVAKALKDKDFEKAAKAKREQMLNHALVREAMKNRSEVTKGIKAMTSPTMGSLEKMPYAFSRQTKDLLSRFSLAKKPVEDIKSLSMIADQMVTAGTTDESEIANATGLVMGPQGWAPESLEAFITRVNQENYGLELPAIALNGSEKEYKSLTMEEFRDVRDSVIAIDEVGKRFDKYLEAFDNASVSATGKAMRAGIEKNLLQRHARAGLIGFEHDTKFSEFWAKVQKISDLLIPDKINILTLSEALDLHYVDGSYQKNPLGLAKETIYRPIAKAYDVRNARVAKEAQAWGEVAARFYTPEEIEAFDKKREKLPELGGMAMDKEKLLALALNWGNETNRDRIRRGYGLTDEQVSKALERLDKRDMDFVQATWDHIDTFWPEVKALEMRVRGHDPRKVEAAPVETIHGTYRGGYYPIKYDFDKSADAAQVELTRAANFGGKSSTYAMTDRGHTKERVNTVKRPVRLSLNVVGEHIVDVVHDLTMREALIDVTRTLRNPDVKLSITNEIGVKGYTAINNWLKAVAGDQSQPMKSVVDRFADWLRFRTTLNSISFRAIILPRKLLVDLSNAVVETGSVPTVMRAIKNYWMNEKENTAFIASKSPMMAALSTMNERDLMDVQKQFQGKESGIRQFAFFAEYFANKWVAAPLWLHIYQTKLGEFGEKKAIELANETIIKTVGSGSPVNLVGAQRGSSLNKMMSMFYSFAATMLNRLWLDGRIAALEYAAGNRSAAIAILASAFASTVIVPKIIDSLFLELAHNTGARPTDWKAVQKRVEERMIMAPFEFFPVGRVVVHALASDVKTDFKISPVEDTITTIMNSLKEQRDVAFGDKHLDKKAMEHAAKVAAILVGSPQTLNNAVFNYWDAAHEGGASLWRDGILGQRRQKK